MSSTKLIMVVDDEEVVRDVLCSFFEIKGYATVAIENGENAISYAETIKPDLILLDIKMPGLNGIETCQRLKQMLQCCSPGTGIIVITGHGSPENLEKSIRSGAIDVVRKPFDLEDISKRVNTWLDVRNFVGESARIKAYSKKIDEHRKKGRKPGYHDEM